MTRISTVIARTHSAEYSLHKYWSRKPHNVLAHFLDALLDGDGKVVLDPFCGSGVMLREAARLGHDAFGFDVNPLAALLSRVTVHPPPVALFDDLVAPILHGEFRERASLAYGSVRYVVHDTVVACPQCRTQVAYGECTLAGRLYRCPDCDTRLHINLKNMERTRVHGLVMQDESSLNQDIELVAREQQRSAQAFADCSQDYEVAFEENRRILAHDGMTTSALFTRRNYSLLSLLAGQLHEISAPDVRDAALLMLTASVAQCSRLIAHRNNMTSGGPAWSVPGFWVPPRHLETNPFVHLSARFKKFRRGIERLQRSPIRGAARIAQCEATEGMRRFGEEGRRADLVFLDPPYGDSVPYLEFSALWNGFLKAAPQVAEDLSVSDRASRGGTWSDYQTGMLAVIRGVKEVLSEDGKLLVTFNNHDLRAWRALLLALQDSKFGCDFVTYQIPAVIPSKAQFSPKGSYLGDIYAVLSPQSSSWTPSGTLDDLRRALLECASARAGRVTENLVLRTIAITWMESNLPARLLDTRDALLAELFERDGEHLIWRGALDPQVEPLEKLVAATANAALAHNSLPWPNLYRAIAQATTSIGMPDPAEVRSLLAGKVIFDGRMCRITRHSPLV